MRTTVATLLFLACTVSAAWIDPSTQPSGAEIARQYQSQDGYGKASYGYSHPGQSSVTHRDADGNQIGSYAYINPEGREIRVNFIADANGYRVDNNYVQETAEVAAARESHLAAHAAALAAAKAASPNQELWEEPPKKTTASAPKQVAPVQQQTWTAPVQQTYTAPVQQTRVAQDTNWLAPEQYFSYRPQQVQETPEVLAAKAEFYRTYAEAAARAPKETVKPKEETWTAPVQQQTWSAPVQQTYTAPVQQPARIAQDTNWLAPEQYFSYRPQQVQETPEVLAAKAEFYRTYAEAAARAPKEQKKTQEQTWVEPIPQQTWSAPAQQTYSAPVQQTYSAPVQQTRVAPDTNWLAPEQYYSYRPQPVQETREVQAARAQFYQSYNAAAALAAQKP